MIFQLHRWLKGRLAVVVADSSYALLDLLNAVKSTVSFITRLRLDAALYDLAPPRPAGKLGPNPLKGKRQPTLAQRLTDPTTQSPSVAVSQWYGEKDKEIKIATGTALCYHIGMPSVVIKWVLLQDEHTAKERQRCCRPTQS